jgi:hypothetical protein
MSNDLKFKLQLSFLKLELNRSFINILIHKWIYHSFRTKENKKQTNNNMSEVELSPMFADEEQSSLPLPPHNKPFYLCQSSKEVLVYLVIFAAFIYGLDVLNDYILQHLFPEEIPSFVVYFITSIVITLISFGVISMVVRKRESRW